ncbi:unnamed protein product [Allacma fusca]|uniref:Malate dehydrogenase, mitochondrial n=1 Tax=Allacma fusca TaxID=39272 RepID=A0A8J2P6P0_9HEXA|nr:unnamed protein product [Allacma fusca]
MLSNGSLIKFMHKFFQHGQQVAGFSRKSIHSSSSVEREFKVSVLGSCGSVGKPLSLLLKHSELISELYLYDVMGSAGIACDLSHIETKANIDTLVPIVSEVFQMNGVYDPRKIFGVSTLNVVRANTFIARSLHLNPLAIDCPVIGGNFGTSVVPLISKCKPFLFDQISDEQVRNITQHIQNASRAVEEAKAGKGATLSMAYAAARFANSLLKGLSGELDIVECAFVRSDIMDSKYFSSEVRLNEDGIEKIKKLSPKMSNFEKELLHNAVPQVIHNVELGEKWMRKTI